MTLIINAATTNPRTGEVIGHATARALLLLALRAPTSTVTDVLPGSHGPTLVAAVRDGEAEAMWRLPELAGALRQDSVAAAKVVDGRIVWAGIMGRNRAGIRFDERKFLMPDWAVARRT